MQLLDAEPRLTNIAMPHACVFAHDDHLLVAESLAPRVSPPLRELAGSARCRAAEAGSILFGVLPFDPHATGFVFDGTSVSRVDRVAWVAQVIARDRSSDVPARAVAAEPTRDAYARLVTQVLARMAAAGSPLTKVVLSRRLSIEFEQPIAILPLVARLAGDPAATVFCFPLPGRQADDARYFVGATPELLVEKRRAEIRSSPLAGSAPRRADAAADRAAAESLERSEKNRREHAATVEWIADRLAPFCRTLTVPAAPTLLGTTAMWHLETRIAGELRDRDVSSLDLVSALHPTPAVCGTPRDLAAGTIAALEPFDRGLFGGVVGWTDAAGDGRWHVAIRCAEIDGATARLYAGAGIVAGSAPADEVDETSAKFRTLLHALNIDETGRPQGR